jgi:RNA polymerase sigma factor (sigma-70 family)
MATGPRPSLASYIRALARPGQAGGHGLSDAELLDRFVTGQDEAAFEVLVWRHGGMVLGVCRRLLGREQDAEDAFQATFLVLVKKAGSIRRREALAGWLYRVACRAARAARQAGAARHEPLTEPLLDTLAAEADDPTDDDLQRFLDDEVNRLPEHYRVPFVLCCLEGKTIDEAAAELGCPRGTVGSAVSRAKDALRARLARRGVAFALPGPAVLPAAMLVRETAHAALLTATSAALPAGLLPTNVLLLTQKVLTTMFLTRLKLVAVAFLLVALLGTTTGLAVHQTFAGSPAAVVLPDERPRAAEQAEAPKIDKAPEDLYGFSGEVVGKLVSKDAEKGSLVLEVRKVTNVWKGNKAPKPKSAEGKTLRIDGVFGKFLDVLVTLKEGDGVQIEVKHVKGDNLTFLGELLKKVELPPAKE